MDDAKKQAYIDEISKLSTNERLISLFTKIPSITVDVFNKTVSYAATKEYEAYIASDNGIPQNFFQMLEDTLKQKGIIGTYKLYQKQIDLICVHMKIERNEFITLLRKISNTDTPRDEKTSAYQKLKEIIRVFTSTYKENMIKEFIMQRREVFERTVSRKKAIIPNCLDVESFINNVMQTASYKARIKKYILEYTGLESVTDDQLKNVIHAIFEKNTD